MEIPPWSGARAGDGRIPGEPFELGVGWTGFVSGYQIPPASLPPRKSLLEPPAGTLPGAAARESGPAGCVPRQAETLTG